MSDTTITLKCDGRLAELTVETDFLLTMTDPWFGDIRDAAVFVAGYDQCKAHEDKLALERTERGGASNAGKVDAATGPS